MKVMWRWAEIQFFKTPELAVRHHALPPPDTTNNTKSASTLVINQSQKQEPGTILSTAFSEPKPNSATYSTLPPY